MHTLSSLQKTALDTLQKKIRYTFCRPELLIQAMTHRSFSAINNERFEFVGDAILNYSVAKMLFDRFPDFPEGQLSRIRSNLVNQEMLAHIARELSLGDCLLLGSGELKSGGFDRPSILADAMEALFAAVSFDRNFACAETLIQSLFHQHIDQVHIGQQAKDAKTLLQENLQARRWALPKYRIVNQSGQPHDMWFKVACDLGQCGIITYAEGSSRRVAEQAAAESALATLNHQFPEPTFGGKNR